MIGTIGFEQLSIRCIIGCCPEERTQEQVIYVDLKVGFDFTRCSLTDDLKDAVDYVKLAEICTELARNRRYHLQETFAAEVLQKLLNEFDIPWAWIKIKKPKALQSAEYATVELKLDRQNS